MKPILAMIFLLIPVAGVFGDERPTYTDQSNAGTIEVDWVLEKVTRNGRQVTLTLTATLTKGPERVSMPFFTVNAVDAEGNEHKARINAKASGPMPPQVVTLRAGVKTKVEFRFPLDKEVSELQTLEVTAALVERVAIMFSDVKVPSN